MMTQQQQNVPTPNRATMTHTPLDSGVPESARDFSVRDQVVVVTGSGQGIGRELARQFAAAGARVVVADVNGEMAAAVAGESATAGGASLSVTVDITDEESVDTLTRTVIDTWGRVDVLINNASIFASIEKMPFDQISLTQWEQVMRVNVTGTFLCVRAISRHMRERGFGRIVNISSDAVPKGVGNYLHYVTSKSAIIGMTNSLARELGPHGITVNCIRPGMVATEVERTVNPTLEVRERAASLQCIPRGMVPTDLVGLILFLSTAASSFITGQTIACDGGYTHSH
jgi:NAD(P)-dependent dehydrogenase (short-subunit alcohol dehydrogenase family)